MLITRGVNPELLPASEDIKKLQRKIKGDEKRVVKDAKRKINNAR